MSTPESPERATESPIDPIEELRQSQQLMLFYLRIVIAAVLLFSGTTFILLFKQTTLLRRQLEGARQGVEHQMAQYQQTQPQMRDFFNKLNDYAKTNPEFTPILNRYFSPSTNSASVTAPQFDANTTK